MATRAAAPAEVTIMAAEARTLASKGVAASYLVVTERAAGSLEAASVMEGGSSA